MTAGQPFPFLALPRELRDNVYQELLPHHTRLKFSAKGLIKNGSSNFYLCCNWEAPRSWGISDISLVSRQIRAEAVRLYCETNTFYFWAFTCDIDDWLSSVRSGDYIPRFIQRIELGFYRSGPMECEARRFESIFSRLLTLFPRLRNVHVHLETLREPLKADRIQYVYERLSDLPQERGISRVRFSFGSVKMSRHGLRAGEELPLLRQILGREPIANETRACGGGLNNIIIA